VRLLKLRSELRDPDSRCLALACRRARLIHRFLINRLGVSSDHWHAICAPEYPLSISVVMKSIKTSSMILMNRQRHESGELWQGRFFDRALRTVKEYNEKVDYIHLNPVKAGLVRRSQDWPWSSVNEYSGVSAAEQERRCGLTIDRVNMPSEERTRI